MTRLLNAAFWTAAILAGPAFLQGGLILDAGAGNGTTPRGSDNGIGTGVSVSTSTTITQMAMSLDMPDGGDIEYMIWDGTDSMLLFSEEQAVTASGTTSYVLSTPFSFDLIAGNTYYFGVIGDNDLNIDYIYPATSVNENGLTTLSTGNSNYTDFADPAPTGGGATTVTLQLFGAADTGTVPEPVACLPIALGMGLFLLRKRLARS